ncbi:MAG: DUF736 domain-containing protein [bacterium]|nr:DUF736 domain-containing protein [bacterium]
MAYDNEKRGVLFRNKDKQNDNHPDMTGKVEINGKEWQLAAWEKQGPNCGMFFSLKVSEPYNPEKEAEKHGNTPPSDDHPF